MSFKKTNVVLHFPAMISSQTFWGFFVVRHLIRLITSHYDQWMESISLKVQTKWPIELEICFGQSFAEMVYQKSHVRLGVHGRIENKFQLSFGFLAPLFGQWPPPLRILSPCLQFLVPPRFVTIGLFAVWRHLSPSLAVIVY